MADSIGSVEQKKGLRAKGLIDPHLPLGTGELSFMGWPVQADSAVCTIHIFPYY